VNVDHPELPYIWVQDLYRGGDSCTDFYDESKSYWSGYVKVIEDASDRKYEAGQVLYVKVGDGKPWFIRPQQYEEDRCSMFIQPCHVIATESEQ